MNAINVPAGSLQKRTAQLFSLLLLLLFITSCNGQVKTNLPTIPTITNGQLKLIKTQGTNQYQNVHCGVQDKAGNLWFGTTGEGVYRYDGKTFTNFTEKDGLSSNTVCSVLEDKIGNLWFGTTAGLCRYDSKRTNGKTFTAVVFAPVNSRFFNPITPTTNTPSAKNAVWSIFQDKSEKIWFGTDAGVYCYDPKRAVGKSFTLFLDSNSIINKDALHLKTIQCILEDKAGNIWFASWNREGVCRYDGKVLTAFKPNNDDMVYSILEDKNGNMWFGTRDHGVCRYNGKTFTDFANIEVFSSSCIYSMTEDKAGIIWFATEHGSGDKENPLGGVWRYDGQSFKNFTTKDGLSHNSVFSVTPDKSGQLWFGTRGMGLCRYDPKQPVEKAFIGFSEKASN